VNDPAAHVAERDVDGARFMELIDDLDAIVWEYEVGSDRYAFVSAACERMLGYPRERWTDEPRFRSLVCHPDDANRVAAAYERFEREGGHHRIEYRAIAADGREIWTRDIVHVVDPGQGRSRLARGISLDITERKNVEFALAETEARYRSLIEHIPAVTYVWDPAGPGSENPRTYVSPQIEAMLGYPPHEWLVDPDLWRGRIHADDAPQALAEFARCEERGAPYQAEYRMIARDGRTVWLRDEAYPVAVDDAGRPTLWQGVLFDISDLRRMEKERHTLLVRLVQAQEEERRRIAGEVHDDSVQKMTALGIRLEALRKRATDPELRSRLDELERSVHLSIARLRHLLFELRPPSLDREGLAAALHEYLEQVGPDGGFQFAVANRLRAEPPIEVRTIAYRIAQEALTNVRKHARASHVAVHLEPRGEGFVTRIVDDGRGFDPRWDGDGRPGHRGLPTMRERAELAGGWLQIASDARDGDAREAGADAVDAEPSGGTSVEFWLPLEEPGRGLFDVG
jgi:PAS domain S-box-containing protein